MVLGSASTFIIYFTFLGSKELTKKDPEIDISESFLLNLTNNYENLLFFPSKYKAGSDIVITAQ